MRVREQVGLMWCTTYRLAIGSKMKFTWKIYIAMALAGQWLHLPKLAGKGFVGYELAAVGQNSATWNITQGEYG